MKKIAHIEKFVSLPNGSGKLECSCGWESPSVDISSDLALGRRQKSLEQYFREHITEVETTMLGKPPETAVAPQQHSQPKTRNSRR